MEYVEFERSAQSGNKVSSYQKLTTNLFLFIYYTKFDMKNLFLYLFAFILLAVYGSTPKIYQWRGDNRDGVYNENNLMQEWPDEGPTELWSIDGIGNGYASPVITDKMMYVCGEIDTVTHLFAYDLQGKKIWQSEVGSEWTKNFRGARSAPTVAGDLIYATTGGGIVACFSVKNGKKIWSRDMMKEFGGRTTRFGFSESVLIDGDKLFCMPGSLDTNVVALNRMNGKLIWKCAAEGQIASYTSPLLIKLPKRKLLVTFSKKYFLGIDATTGEMLWSHKQDTLPQSLMDVHCNTPLYENGYLYYVTGDGNGAVKLKLSGDGKNIEEIWRNRNGWVYKT